MGYYLISQDGGTPDLPRDNLQQAKLPPLELNPRTLAADLEQILIQQGFSPDTNWYLFRGVEFIGENLLFETEINKARLAEIITTAAETLQDELRLDIACEEDVQTAVSLFTRTTNTILEYMLPAD